LKKRWTPPRKDLGQNASLQEKIDTRNTELDTHYEKMIISQERTMAMIGAWLAEMKDGQKEATKANPEKMEANPDEMKSLTVHEEVAKEEAVVNLLEH
jgi:hypothetical protein